MKCVFENWQQELVGRLQSCARIAGGKEQLASRSGVSLAQLYRYLNGTQTPHVTRLFRIAEASGVKPSWLLGADGDTTTDVDQCRLNTVQDTYVAFELAYLEYGGSYSAAQKAEILALLVLAVELEKKQAATSELLDNRRAMLEALYFLQPFVQTGRISAYSKGVQQLQKATCSRNDVQRFTDLVSQGNCALFNSKVGELYYNRVGMDLPGHRLHLLHELQKKIVQAIGLYRQLHVLDLGCGNGRHLLHWAKTGAEKLVGVDGSPLAIAAAKRHATVFPRIKWIEADVCRTGLAANQFTFINCMSVLNYLPYVAGSGAGAEALIAEAYRLLQDGGVMHVAVRAGTATEYVPFERAYSPQELIGLAQKQGFRVLNLQQEDLSHSAETCIPTKYRLMNFMLLQK